MIIDPSISAHLQALRLPSTRRSPIRCILHLNYACISVAFTAVHLHSLSDVLRAYHFHLGSRASAPGNTHTCEHEAMLRPLNVELFPSAQLSIGLLPTIIFSARQTFYFGPYVSLSRCHYRVLIVQISTNPRQCAESLRKADQKKPRRPSTRLTNSGLRLSRRHSRRPTAANPRAGSIPEC